MRILLLLAALVATASAQLTTVTGTLSDPLGSGNRLTATLTFKSGATFRSGSGWIVPAQAGRNVSVIAGRWSAQLVPTDTAQPAGQYYEVTGEIPNQTIDGRNCDVSPALMTQGLCVVQATKVGPWYLPVPSSATPVEFGNIYVSQRPPASIQVQLSQLGQGGAAPRNVPCWSGTQWVPCSGFGGIGSYTASISGTSVTILATTHGLGAWPIVGACMDAFGVEYQPGGVSRNSSGDITISSAASMSGSCRLVGSVTGTGIYLAAVSGTSTTIPAATHGLTAPVLGACYDASNAQYQPGAFSRDAFGAVTITSSTPMAGYCILQ